MTDRRDPTLGDLPVVADAGPTPKWAQRRDSKRKPDPAPRKRLTIGVLVVIALALAAWALHHWRSAIGARLVPPPQQNSLMHQAEVALHSGKLTSPDGRGARELYQAVLARDPDDMA